MTVNLKCVAVLFAFAAAANSATVHAAFTPYIIRNDGGGNPPTIQANNDYVPGATEFVISAGGQKAALGSSDIDGYSIGNITNLSITRYDDTTRFNAGSGPAVAPYFNIWVTDGLGKYAVLANEPSNPGFQPLFVDNGNGSKTYSLSFDDIMSAPVKVYETPNGGGNSTTTWVHDLFGNQPLTFADVSSLKVAAPSAGYITDPLNAVSGGAPRELGTNVAYGFNWVFGDTLSNYVSGMEGYVVGSPLAAAVPEPASVALLATCAMSLVLFRSRAIR